MGYEHTQTGRITLFVGAFFVIIGVVSVPAIYGEDPAAAVILIGAIGVILGTVVVFNRLTVAVGNDAVKAAFGWGWPRRTFAFHDIAAVRQVRNSWIFGWGSRWIPGGWMYNVWGRDGVELYLTSGRKFRIGTDDPEGLLAAFPPELVAAGRR